MPTLLVTGATGFVGRAALPVLARAASVRALVRGDAALPDGCEAVRGDLDDADALRAAVEGVDGVVHLAACTGKAPAAEFERVNAAGTRRLLAAAREAGVRYFVLVSTIAATYPDKRSYPYARSKESAESAVRESGLSHAILRPTIVLGTESGIGETLRGFAGAPVLPLLGPAGTRIQPVHRADVADAIALLVQRLESGEIVEGAFDLGGPDVLTFHDFLRRLRDRVRDGGPELRIPLGLVIPALSLVEPLLLPVLPVTAGQLSAFVQDGVASEGDLDRVLADSLRSLDTMIEETAARG